eukprot:103984_1
MDPVAYEPKRKKSQFLRANSLAFPTNRAVIPWSKHIQSGFELLRNPRYNKGRSFSEEERTHLFLQGLLPPAISTMQEQAERTLQSMRKKDNPLDKYVQFMSLLERNEKLFYHILINNVVELMPIVYTPTVGEACLKFGHIYQEPRSLWISLRHRGQIARVLNNWPDTRVKAVVFTDGERILGLGDLGALGMGIPIGKLCLYTACAGIPPQHLLPVLIDVGTDNETLLKDSSYVGLRQKRDRTELYDELIEEFMTAVANRYGASTLLQFEDFGNRNAQRLLDKYKDRFCCFNDDIQGTAAVGLAGILAAMRIKNEKLSEQIFLLYGAGSAGLGIARLIADCMSRDENMPLEECRSRIWLVDSRGLVVKGRSTGGISPLKAIFAHEHSELTNLAEVVKSLKVSCIIGVSAQSAAFSEDVCRAMAEISRNPIIFPMSNPTSKSECSAKDAFKWTKDTCIFASGSPFDPVTISSEGGENMTITPSQGNNAYIFPGLALGLVCSGSKRVPDPDFLLIAAKTLAGMVSDAELAKRQIYPPLKDIRKVSTEIAVEIAKESFKLGLNTVQPPANVRDLVNAVIYKHDSYDTYIDQTGMMGSSL